MQPLSNIRNLNVFKHERKIWQKVAWPQKNFPESIVQILSKKHETLETEWKQEGTLLVTLNRLAKLNAINNKMIAELDDTLNDIYNTSAIKSVIITGAGEKAFVAGADISELEKLDQKTAVELAKTVHELFNKIEKCPKPVIAAVNGFAFGGGFELVLSCHLAVGSENATFGFPETKLGLIPGFGGTQRLTRQIGKKCALGSMLTGNLFSAKDLKDLQLLNLVVPLPQLLDAALELVHTTHSKASLAQTKVIVCVNAAERGGPKGFRKEIKLFGECFKTKDCKEGIQAFLEKRPPNFTGE